MNLFEYFHIKLTFDQNNALKRLIEFFEGDKQIFILQGYAGSGKTTLLKGIIDYLNDSGRKYQLMAPTGRAAKVIQQKTSFLSTTVHKGIYSFNDLEEIKSKQDENNSLSFKYYFKIRNNPEVIDSVLLVDEASMISDVYSENEHFRFGSGKLLSDLISYSRIQMSGSGTKIIFIGDPAQLPPVGMNHSPALDENYLKKEFGLTSVSAEMKEVKRQKSDNGVLLAATRIRKCLTSGYFNDFNLDANGKDIFNPLYGDFLRTYKEVSGTKIVISYKNKTAVTLNENIRRDKYCSDVPIREGDIIIVSNNNYSLGIMNGEFGIITRVEKVTVNREIRFYKKDGGKASVLLQWRLIEMILPDENGNDRNVSGYMLENFLKEDNSLSSEQQQALFVDFRNRHSNLKPKTEEYRMALKNDPYFNCILLKYGYAVTCHKAQGGEWDNAFIFWDKGVNDQFNFLKNEHDRTSKYNAEFYRWAYTAITRAAKRLYCINPPQFNSFSGMNFIDGHIQNAYQELTNTDVKPVEIDLTGDYLNALNRYIPDDFPLMIQNHFLKLFHLVKAKFIDIEKWEKVNYEIRYYFKREKDTAAIKFWINGKNIFKDSFQNLPAATNSDALFSEIASLIEKPINFVVHRNTIETIVPKIEFDIKTEEEKPFLKTLFDKLQEILLTKGIRIANIDHHEYRERYTIVKGQEKAVIDFEYDGKGFFGRVLPLDSKSNSQRLSVLMKDIVNQLKES